MYGAFHLVGYFGFDVVSTLNSRVNAFLILSMALFIVRLWLDDFSVVLAGVWFFEDMVFVGLWVLSR